MKRNKPRRQRYERALRRKQLKDAYSGKWFSVKVRKFTNIFASTCFDVVSDIAGITRGELANFLAFGTVAFGVRLRSPLSPTDTGHHHREVKHLMKKGKENEN